MMTFILIIHSITCVLLVLTILMQSGRGGGLTEQFASAESVFGAQTSSFMVRLSTILATVFFVTSLTLALMSSRQEKSLMANSLAMGKAPVVTDVKTKAEAMQEVKEDVASSSAEVPPVPAHAPEPKNAPNTILDSEPKADPQAQVFKDVPK